MAGYCEVALPVPLRTTFTYGVPDALEETVTPGSRVLVPFRNRAMLGVVLECSKTRPDLADIKIKNVSEVWDPVPALPDRLVELGRWVANYYLAPVGETFRAMLPPNVELRVARAWRITDAGVARLQALETLTNRSQTEVDDLAMLQLCGHQDKPVPDKLIAKLPGGKAAAARLLRRGELIAGDLAERKKARTQWIVAWNPRQVEHEGREANGPGNESAAGASGR